MVWLSSHFLIIPISSSFTSDLRLIFWS